ncbi:nucleotide pyrophosphohydrolase [Streptococcus danieliae]|nr:nucleotide pyrophosphohydrolase [Streptococcus danieliae]
MTDKLIQDILKFRDDRGWGQAHSPRNLASSIIIEAAELLENYQWGEEFADPINVQEEIADVLIYTLLLTDRLGLDVETIVQDKLKKNALKYPVASEKLK